MQTQLAVAALLACQCICAAAGYDPNEFKPEIEADAITTKSGYYFINNRKYYVANDASLTWLDAVLECNGRNMALVSFEDSAETDAVYQFLQQQNLLQWSMWTSGKYVKDAGWMWTGSGRAFDHTAWRATQPDQETLTCDAVYFSGSGWSDNGCTIKNFAMCEESESETGYHTINDRPYYIGANTMVSWLGAVDACNGLGLSLASLETKVESDAVLAYLQSKGLQPWMMWTSGKYVKSGGWLWTGSGRQFSQTAWGVGEPNQLSATCAAAALMDDTWRDEACSVAAFYICE